MVRAGRRSHGAILAAALLAGLLAGCTPAPSGVPLADSASGSPSTTGPSVAPGAATASSPASIPVRSVAPTGRPTKVTATVTQTNPGRTLTVGPPAPTPTPPTVIGDCPYLPAGVVSDITGQHHGDTKLISFKPHPMCLFYRSDGGFLGSVRIIVAASPQQAVAAVNQHVPIADSQPASQPAGWLGGSMTTPGQMTQDSTAQSVYAVSKGNVVVVAEENESPSLKARVMAVCAIYGLKLNAGPVPGYCSAGSG